MASAGAIPQGASYQPSRLLREVAVDVRQAAVLFIDVQNYNCHKGGAMYRSYTTEELEGPEFSYWWARIDDCTKKWAQLQKAARACKIEVIYTVIQSLTADGRERSLDYKISGFHVPPGCWDAKVIDAIAPGPDEVVLPKTSSSVFNSTTLDYILRNMDKRFLIIAGCVTEQCVAHAVKDAADLGYLVTLVTDCCATFSADRHMQACDAVGGYCRQRTLDVLLEEFATVAAKAGILMDGGAGGAGFGGAGGGAGPSNMPHPAAPSSGFLSGLNPHSGGFPNGPSAFSGGGGGGSAGGGLKRGFAAIAGADPASGSGGVAAGAAGGGGEHYSGDNFSRGDDSDDQGLDDDDDDGEYGGRSGRSKGGSSRRHGGRNRGRNVGSDGGGREGKKVYFEYAKMQWESEREFMLPNGKTWVEIAVRGDPNRHERGLIYCRLCRHYNKGNIFAKGYKAGKRSALKEHMQTKDHKELVEALEAGVIQMPSFSSMPMQPCVLDSPAAAAAAMLPPPPPPAAAAAAGDHQRIGDDSLVISPIHQGSFDAQQPHYHPAAAAAAAVGFQQQQQYSDGEQYNGQQQQQPQANPLSFIGRTGTFDSVKAAAALMHMGGTATAAAAGGDPAAAFNLGLNSLISGAVGATVQGPGSNLQPPQASPFAVPAAAAAAAGDNPSGGGAAAAAGSSNGGVIDREQLVQAVAQIAAAAGFSNEGLRDIIKSIQDPNAGDLTAEQAAAAITMAFTQAAAAAGLDSEALNDALATMTGGDRAAAGQQQRR